MFVTQVSVYNLSIRPTTIWYCCATLGTLRNVHQKYVRICVLWEAMHTCSHQVANLATTYVLSISIQNLIIYTTIYMYMVNIIHIIIYIYIYIYIYIWLSST